MSFGLSLLLVGVAHYQTIGNFSNMVAQGLGPLEPLGSIWAYVLPALMIVGGALYTVNRKTCIAGLASGVALGSIPVGMLLKAVLDENVALGDMMGPAINAFIWLLVYAFVVKSTCCKE